MAFLGIKEAMGESQYGAFSKGFGRVIKHEAKMLNAIRQAAFTNSSGENPREMPAQAMAFESQKFNQRANTANVFSGFNGVSGGRKRLTMDPRINNSGKSLEKLSIPTHVEDYDAQLTYDGGQS